MDWLRDYYIKISEPKSALTYSVCFLLLWLFLGTLDYFYFSSKFSNSANKISWLKDVMGHWMTLFALLTPIFLCFFDTYIEGETTVSMRRLSQRVFKKMGVKQGHFLFLICLVFAFANGWYVSQSSALIHWQTDISKLFLPFTLALLFFIGVFLPILLCITRLLISFNILCAYCERIRSFSTADPKGMFGLEPIGNLITVFLCIGFLASFPMLLFQLHFKQGELTFGFAIGFILLLFLFYFAVIKPMLFLVASLQPVKQGFLLKTNQEWQALMDSLEKQTPQEYTEQSVALTNMKLTLLKDKRQACLNLRLLPLDFKAKLLALSAAFPSLGTLLNKVIVLL